MSFSNSTDSFLTGMTPNKNNVISKKPNINFHPSDIKFLTFHSEASNLIKNGARKLK